MKNDQKVLYIDINGIYENHNEHMSILCGKKSLFMLQQVVHTLTTEQYTVKGTGTYSILV